MTAESADLSVSSSEIFVVKMIDPCEEIEFVTPNSSLIVEYEMDGANVSYAVTPFSFNSPIYEYCGTVTYSLEGSGGGFYDSSVYHFDTLEMKIYVKTSAFSLCGQTSTLNIAAVFTYNVPIKMI